DATNVIARPAMTALTPISIDHEGFLGSSLEGIAAEKAGILKANTPCIMAAQSDDAAAIIRDRAKSLGAPLIEQGAGWSYEDLGGAFSVATGLRKMNLPLPSLTGAHQIANAAQAVTIFDHVAVPMAAENIIGKGLAAARWPARLQQLKIGPLLAHLPQGWELWLDGGHNAAAGKILATQAEQWSDKPLYLISGVLNTKDAGAIFRPLAPFVKKLSALRIPNEEASLSADELAALAGIGGMTCQTAATVSDALQKIIDDEKLPSRILICGSLYLAGQVLAENG
ncbi:MAG: bifunctional folylpolyglutamate synthase/dihydrofolate synthase, partial [Rhodospirillales bacterium]|nr:bifunctional folylpolyglutamate synthase/dihydrofolate synthase [Rhodospirillales bacterium]